MSESPASASAHAGSAKRATVTEGHDVLGRDVIDGMIFVNGRWIPGEIFDPKDYTIKEQGGNKESSKNSFDSHKEVPEPFRKAVEYMIDSLGAAGYDVEFRFKSDEKSSTAGITVKKRDKEKDLPVAETPLEVATLPRVTPPGKDPHKDFKTAEERDEEERKHPGSVSGVRPAVVAPTTPVK